MPVPSHAGARPPAAAPPLRTCSLHPRPGLSQLRCAPRVYVSCNASDPACAAAEVLALRKRLYAVRRDLGALACQHLGIGPTGAP